MVKYSKQLRYQTPENIIVLGSGLALTAAAFWFRTDFVLHGGGAATIGIIFAYAGLAIPCNWLLALCTGGATICYSVAGFEQQSGSNGYLLTLAGICLSGLVMIISGMRYFKVKRSRVTGARAS
jgi:hypothetical protein